MYVCAGMCCTEVPVMVWLCGLASIISEVLSWKHCCQAKRPYLLIIVRNNLIFFVSPQAHGSMLHAVAR